MRSDSLQQALEGTHDGKGRRLAVIETRWNEEIISMLRGSCLATLREQGAEKVETFIVPGAMELPVTARTLAATGRFDAIIALGCVIRGETPHFDYVAGEAARGLTDAALATGLPVIFGVLTVNTYDQAETRANPDKDNKGREFALAGLEMANLIHSINTIKEADHG